MTYAPRGTLGFETITTTEALSGRTIDGVASYVKLVKSAGSLTNGASNNFAHGISGMTRLVSVFVSVEDQTPQWIPVVGGYNSASGSLFGLSVSVDATNVIVDVGSAWAATNLLENFWVVLEYLK